MNRSRIAMTIAAVFALAGPLAAQEAVTPEASPVPVSSIMLQAPTTAPPLTLGGVTETETTTAESVVLLPPQQRRSSDVAMMIVGGAALLVGSVVGGDSGTIIMVGGGVVGLIGLYRYMRY